VPPWQIIAAQQQSNFLHDQYELYVKKEKKLKKAPETLATGKVSIVLCPIKH
jgi:hypothetical protein